MSQKRMVAAAGVALAGILTLAGVGIFQPIDPVDARVAAVQSTNDGSGLVVTNLSDVKANITISAYNADGSVPAGFPALGFVDTIDPNKSKSYFSEDTNAAVNVYKSLPAGSKVSFVVSADQPVTANVNLQRISQSGADTLGTAANPFRVSTSSGVVDTQFTTTIYAPQVTKNCCPGQANAAFQSRVYVQNASPTDAATTWTVLNRAGASVATFNKTIKPYATYEFNIATESATSALPDDIYSLKVTGSNSVNKLGMTISFMNSGVNETNSQFQSYNGLGIGDTTLWAPRVVRKYFGFNSGLRVQNIGTAATTIRFSYTFNGTTYTLDVPNVGPGQAVGPYMGDDNGDKPAGVIALSQVSGGAKIESIGQDGNPAQPIIGNVNEDNRSLGMGATYNLFRTAEAANTATIAQVVNTLGNNETAAVTGWYISGVQYQNVGTGVASCTATFSQAGRADVTKTDSNIPVSGSISLFAKTDVPGLTDSFNGSVTVACDQKVVAISNLSVRSTLAPFGFVGLGDSFSQNNGTNR